MRAGWPRLGSGTPAVNRLVAGSNPARGANKNKQLSLSSHLPLTSLFHRGSIWGSDLQISLGAVGMTGQRIDRCARLDCGGDDF
jgi:hypothetical protein